MSKVLRWLVTGLALLLLAACASPPPTPEGAAAPASATSTATVAPATPAAPTTTLAPATAVSSRPAVTAPPSLVTTSTSVPTAAATLQPGVALSPDGYALLGRGVNLGNALEAPSVEGEWGLVIEEAYFERIAEAGFDSVRIPIRWNAHAGTEPPYALSGAILARVDEVVAQALSHGLAVVINIHHYEALFQQPASQRERFLAIWRQIAEHYADAEERLFFEVLNEPHDALDGALWNRYAAEAIAVIRESNRERWIIVGPGSWNGFRALEALELPEDDRRLVATFHYYEPFEFTHQGAEWTQGSSAWLGTTWEDTPREVDAIRDALYRAQRWAEVHGRPVYLGEFGAYSRADLASRVRWTARVAREAEACGFGWAYWEFGAGFGVYDPVSDAWRPELLEALLPATTAHTLSYARN